MPQVKELKEKIAKMEAGLSNPHIAESLKPTMRKAIENAKAQLKELDTDKPKTKSEKTTAIPLKDMLGKGMTPSISVKFVDKKHTDNPIWYTQRNWSTHNLDAKMKFAGEEPKEENIVVFDGMVKAKNAGYKFNYYIAGKYAGIYIFQKDGNVLTQHGFNVLKSNSSDNSPTQQSNDIFKKELDYVFIKDGKDFSTRHPGTGRWTDNYNLAYVYEGSESKAVFEALKREFPEYDITFKEYKSANPELSKINMKVLPPINPTLKFMHDMYCGSNRTASTVISKIQADRIKQNGESDFFGEELTPVVFLFFMRMSKFAKHVAELFNISSKDFLDLLYYKFPFDPDNKEQTKLRNELADALESLVLSNFTTKSQFAAMKSKELEEVRKDAYLTIINAPLAGEEQDDFHLHYFNSGSDVYISDVDYGTNAQDFGYTILNGDLQNSEYGYVSIQDLLKNGYELDLYFEPENKKRLIASLQEKESKNESENDSKTNFIFTPTELSVHGRYMIDAIQEIGVIEEIKEKEVMFSFINKNKVNIAFSVIALKTELRIECFVNDVLVTEELLIVKYSDFDNDYKKIVAETVKSIEIESKDYRLTHQIDIEDEDVEPESNQPSITEAEIETLVTIATAQIFLEHGSNTEIVSIDEMVLEDHISIDFKLIREIDGMRDRTETTTVHVSFDGEIQDEFTFPLPNGFDCTKFIISLMDDFDKRTKNQIYSYSTFLRDHSEEHVGEKVASKTVKKLSVEKQDKLKSEYKKKVATRKETNTTSKATQGKVKLTKRLKAHGVTQAMVDKVNSTKDGIVIKEGKQAPGKNSKHDSSRKAMLPGKRLSASGKIYYEYRKNRSDQDPKKRI